MVAPTLDTKSRKKKEVKLLRMEQCPECRKEGRDNSKDNLGTYDDGHSYCFACGYYSLDNTKDLEYPRYTKDTKEFLGGTKGVIEDKGNYSYQYLGDRGVSRDTMEYYGTFTKVDEEGRPLSIAFPYGSYSIVRSMNPRSFVTLGDGSQVSLFGQDKFNSGSSKSITITEGAYDAMSIYEALGRKYPAVSVRSASTAESDCASNFDYLNSFQNIYLCFDNDQPGMDAARAVARLFDPTKIYHVKLDRWKDANAALQDNPEELRRVWWNAKKYQPKGVKDVFDSAKEILEGQGSQPNGTFPFPTLDAMCYGTRPGELYLFTALEKVGKTEVLRTIEHHLLKTTTENIGIIHLEEQEKRSVQGLLGIELGVPAHLPDSGLSLQDQESAITSLVKHSGRLYLHSHFGSDDPDDILGLIHYLVAVNKCKFIFLDHLTMLVTGLEGDDERRTLDYLSTKLARMTRDLQFTLFLVSHVNDDGQTRGSRMPSKLCDLEVYLSRDKEASDGATRNRTRLMVRNNRFGAITGPAGHLIFDPKTFRLTEEVTHAPPMSDVF